MARRRKATGARRAGVGVLFLLAALVLGLSFLPRATGVAVLLGGWQRLLLGRAAAAIPALCALIGFVLIVAGERARFTPRVQGLLLLGLAAAAAGHTGVPAGGEYAAMRAGQGTGALGAVLVRAGRTAVGEVGLGVLIGLVGSAGLSRLFHVSVADVVRFLAAGGLWGFRALRALARRVPPLARNALAVAGPWTRRGLGTLARWAMPAVVWARERLAPHRVPPEIPAAGPVVAAEPPGAQPEARTAETDTTEAVPVLPSPVAAPQFAAVPVGPPGARRRRERVHQESLLPEPPQQYTLPPLDLLGDLPASKRGQRWDPSETARALEATLASFGVEAKVVHWEQGPVVTRFEVHPAAGVRVQKIASLTNDIALNLAAPSVRIEAPIPGKSAVGIEIPNQKASLVHIKEILETPSYQTPRGPLIMALGKDLTGHPIVADLTEMPHLLIAGATGSGKSVAMNSIIASFLFRCTPRECRFVMIDPKRIELTNYNQIPHLLVPVVTHPRAAAGALREMLRVMEERFERFAQTGVRNIQAYNELADVTPLPFIVVFVDELADLMMVAPADFEDVICRLAQMTRATGIHLVVATQRPSVDVITGLIKANIPSRIAFAVSSQVDSRTIIDGPGAEKLLGRGDMLFLPMGASRAVRAQGSFIADQEIQALVEWWRGQGRPAFDETLLQVGQKMASVDGGEEDGRLADAARIVVRAGYGSVSLLQRKMRIGYVTAARLIDQLEERGIVGPSQGSTPREVLVGLHDLDRLLAARA